MRTFPLLTQRVAASLAVILGVSGVALTATPASATGEPDVTIGTPTGAGVVGGVVTTESAITVPITISGFDSATKLDVKISVPVGEGYFSVASGGTAIAADVGYTDSTEVTEYAFNGTVADVTSVLASGVSWVAPATSTGDITVSVAQTEAGLYYNHENGHYYKPVNDVAVTWGEAADLADNTTKFGMVGYLATVTSRQENNFITYNTTENSMWLGGSDAGASNGSTYTWRTGPESGQQFWSGNENGSVSDGMYAGWHVDQPSNTRYYWNFGFANDYENYTVINWDQRGRWSDLMDDPRDRDFNNDQVNWYLVEYGGMGSDVPTALIADDTTTLEASDSIRSGEMSGGTFSERVINAPNNNPKSFAIDLQRFTNTSASQLAVTLSLPANSGTFTIPVTTGLTLETGYSSFTAQSAIGFVGAKSTVITALENLRWNPPAGLGKVTASISVAEKESGIFYNTDNGHYYQVKTWGSDTSVSSANTFANSQIFAGMTGYLATITTDAENDFIANHTTAANAWIGATDDTSTVNDVSDQRYSDQEGNWYWFTGPEAGLQFFYDSGAGSTRNGFIESWASGEPSNSSTIRFPNPTTYENFAVTNRGDTPGLWNDIENSTSGVRAAIIEYGGMPTEPNKSKSVSTEFDLYRADSPGSPMLLNLYGIDNTSARATFIDGDANGAEITIRQYSIDGGGWIDITEDLVATNGEFTMSGLAGPFSEICIRAGNLAGWGGAYCPYRLGSLDTPIDGFPPSSGLEQVMFTPDGSTAYVTASDTDTVWPITVDTGQLGEPIVLPPGSNPSGVAFSPDGSTAYVTGSGTDTVWPITVDTGELGEPIIFPASSGLDQVVFSPDGSTAYVTASDTDTVWPITVDTGQLGEPIVLPPGSNPRGVAFSPDGSTAYVTASDTDTIWPITVDTGELGEPIIFPAASGLDQVVFTPDGSTAYVTASDTDTVWPITVDTGELGEPIVLPEGSYPNGVAFSPDGSTAYVTASDSDTVWPITVDTGALGMPISLPVGSYPNGVAFSPDGTLAYVVNSSTSTVSVIITGLSPYTPPDTEQELAPTGASDSVALGAMLVALISGAAAVVVRRRRA